MVRLITLTCFALMLGVVPARSQVYICPHNPAAAKQGIGTVYGPGDAYAYNTSPSGAPIIWDLQTVPIIEWYASENLPANGAAVIAQGFDDWQAATGITFVNAGTTSVTDFPVRDSLSVMQVADNETLEGAEGKTQRHLSTTYDILETDIGYRLDLLEGVDDGYILSVVRHEIGHLLGLQHVNTPESLMFPSISLLEVNKPIDEGTRDGIRYLYGGSEGLAELAVAYDAHLAQTHLGEPYPIAEVAIDPGRVQDVVASSLFEPWLLPKQTFISRDGGEVWIESGTPILTLTFAPSTSGILYSGSSTRVVRTTDHASTFTFQEVGGLRIQSLAVHPTDPDIAYAGLGTSVWKTTDGGGVWSLLPGTPSSLFTNDMAIHPASPNTVFLATDTGLYRSTDAGASWTESGSGIERSHIHSVAFDPVVPSIMFAGADFGVYKSTTGGGTWTVGAPVLSATPVTRVLVEPYNRTAYAVTGIGLYRSTDRGITWSRFGADLGIRGIKDIASNPLDPDVIFVATDYGLHRTIDGGATFDAVLPVLSPSIVLPREALAFGDVEVGLTRTETFVVRNEGFGPLRITDIQADLDAVSFTDSTLTVPAGEEAAITIRFSPSQGSVSGIVTLYTNDPASPTVSVPITGTGIVILADPRADFDGDGTVGFTDFVSFAAAYGSSEAQFDLDGSGTVDFADFVAFATSFGRPTS